MSRGAASHRVRFAGTLCGLVVGLLLSAPPGYGRDLATLEEVCLGNLNLGVCESLPDALENPAQQGIASRGAKFYTSRGVCFANPVLLAPHLYEWEPQLDGSWMNTNHAVAHGFDMSLCHLGDIAIDGDDIYGPMSDFDQVTGATKFHVARFDVTTLGYEADWEATGLPMNFGDLAGLDFHAGDLYAIEYQDGGSADNAHIVKFNPPGLDTISVDTAWEISTRFANGIAFDGDLILISNGNDPNEGLIDYYDLGSLSTVSTNSPQFQRSYDVSGRSFPQGAHAEGLTLQGDSLWVCAGGGDIVRRLGLNVPSLGAWGVAALALLLGSASAAVAVRRRRAVG